MTRHDRLLTKVRTARRRLCRRVTAAVAGAAWIYACGAGRAPGSSVERPNVVLISVDSLRADHLGCYGYPRPTSPAIDGLAAAGALFEVATSSSSWTLPAHRALFTGLSDSVYGVDGGARALAPESRTLAEALQAAGYRTAGVWSSPRLDPELGFGQGFDAYVSHSTTDPDGDRAVAEPPQAVTGPSLSEKVETLLAPRTEDPFFLFVQLGRGDPSRRGPEHAAAMDDGEIAGADQQIGQILRKLQDLGAAEDTMVIVTSDHGEERFDRGSFGHQSDESIRIPLVVRYPGRIPAGERIDLPARIVDVAPTIVELAGGEPLPDVPGRSLVPVLKGRSAPHPALPEQLESLTDLDVASVQEPEGPLRAEPNPIRVCDGTGLGVTTLRWSLPGVGGPLEVRVDAPDGKLFAQMGATGAATTGRWARDGMTFFLVEGGTGEVLGKTAIRVTRSGCRDE